MRHLTCSMLYLLSLKVHNDHPKLGTPVIIFDVSTNHPTAFHSWCRDSPLQLLTRPLTSSKRGGGPLTCHSVVCHESIWCRPRHVCLHVWVCATHTGCVCVQVTSTSGLSIGQWVRLNLDDPGDGSLLTDLASGQPGFVGPKQLGSPNIIRQLSRISDMGTDWIK